MDGPEDTICEPISTAHSGASNLTRGDLAPGTVLGRYLVIARIGRGGMGCVYRAYDPELDRCVAVKIVAPRPSGRLGKNKQARIRLLREAQALAQLSHPNVVAVYDVGPVGDSVFVAMELIEGVTLKEWLSEEKRPRAEVLNVLRQAGHGLAAAHEANIVHRDFKPSNVAIGSNGRVWVLDFGLARSAGVDSGGSAAPSGDAPAGSPEETPDSLEGPTASSAGDATPVDGGDPPSEESKRLLGTPLTQVGRSVGTPSYMAPEQHLAQRHDVSVDQFAFCVVCLEALLGGHPFQGETNEELADAVIHARLRDLPPRCDVPAWLLKILLRGIAADPGQRYPSMSELLEDLAHDPEAEARERQRRRWRAWAIGVTLAIGLVGAGLAWQSIARRRGALCQSAASHVAKVWNLDRRMRVRDVFLATERPYSDSSVRGVLQTLDRFGQAWVGMHTKACQASHVHATQSPELLDARMLCLEERLSRLDALIAEFEHADAMVVEKALQASLSLADVQDCADRRALSVSFSQPEGPVDRAKVAAIRKELSHVSALRNTGQYKLGLSHATELVELVKGVSYPPLETQVVYELGLLHKELGEFEEAYQRFEQATKLATKRHDGRMVVRSMTEMIWIVGYEQGRFERALGLAQGARAVLDLEGGNDADEVALLLAVGVVHHWALDNHEVTRDFYERALRIGKQALGPNHPTVARLLYNLGTLYDWDLGDYNRARDHYQRALRIEERVRGPTHPAVTPALGALGLLDHALGNYAQAQSRLEQAIDITERARGSDHPEVAVWLHNLGLVLHELGDFKQARELCERGLAIEEKARGPEYPQLAASYEQLAVLAVDEFGDYRRAAQLYERALSIVEKAHGPEHPRVADTLSGLAWVRQGQGRNEEALALAQRAVRAARRATGSPNETLATALSGLAEAFWGLERPAQALAPLREVISICAKIACQPRLHGPARFALARAVWATAQGEKDRSKARELARSAIDVMVKVPLLRKSRREVQAWLGLPDISREPLGNDGP